MVVFASDNGGASIHTSNAPLRLGKGTMFEGGIRVPTVFSWEGVIRAGATLEVPIHGVDFLPTFAEASTGGSSRPSARPQLRHGIGHVDGVSLMPLLAADNDGTAGAGLRARALFWHFPHYLVGKDCTAAFNMSGTQNLLWRGVPSSAVRLGEWKLILNLESNASLLFNVVADVGETVELSLRHPAEKNRLERLLLGWLRAVDAPIPETNPGFVQCPPRQDDDDDAHTGVDGRAGRSGRGVRQPSPRHEALTGGSPGQIGGAEDCGAVELRRCILEHGT